MDGGLKKDSKKSLGKFSFLTGIEGASKQLPCVLYFSWGSIANGARRELARPSSRHTSTTHTHTHWETYILCPLSPSANHIHWLQTDTEQGDCTFPDPAASLDLLHYLDLLYDSTTRHCGLQECRTVLQSHEYTHSEDYSHPGEAIENTFSFPGATVWFIFSHSQAWEMPGGCSLLSTTSWLAKR